MIDANEMVLGITLSGRFTIENSQKLHEEVEDFLNNTVPLEIYINEIEEMDFSFLQLLYSVVLTARTSKKKISVFTDNGEMIKNLLVHTGYESHFTVKKNRSGANCLIGGIYYD